MNFNKRVSGSWTDTPYYIHNTSTDTITALPADIYANDTTATVGLKGNMSQSSTPTPTNPIQPQETGERTGNLFDTSAITANRYVSNSNGELVYISGGILCASDYIDISGASYVSISNQGGNEWGAFYGADKVFISGISGYSSALQIPNNAKYMRLTVKTEVFNSFMVNLGSTALPYEPYGYKIPISSANTTTPVYLGEVETTRRIKKLVLTGEEEWIISTGWKKTATSVFYMALADIIHTSAENAVFIYSNAFSAATRNELYNGDSNMVARTGTEALTIRVSDSIATTVADFKSYLAQQYANGTPVTIWYVLATPTTGIVNEPLRKIGDYADEVSGITIPTIAGANTLSVDTTLQPSEVSVNYKGWHPVQSVHEAENGQWD